ncbi:hypothetical protein F4818DRAFT_419084 [Hypoxylon cercidicola]|nr:hypothetical protein F4818DRAFT_419084 [Hypoxylon cercidicola]
MSDTTMPTAAEKEPSPFERLPPETIIQIFSSLTSLKSVLHLCLASRRFHAILSQNEGAIARGFAITLLEEDDPSLLKLAFMACESRIVDQGSKDSVAEFIAAYVHRDNWPLKLYRFRALHSLAKTNMGVELLVDWIATYATTWPLKLESKAYTRTEITRLKRYIYIWEVGVCLFESVSRKPHKEEFWHLAMKFWDAFSLCELVSLSRLWCTIERNSFWTHEAWSASTGRRQDGASDWPWNTSDEPRDVLNSIRHGRQSRFLRCKILRSMNWVSERTNPFAKDPTAYGLDKSVGDWLWDPDQIWGKRDGLFDPRSYQYAHLHRLFFDIGDKDRCQFVRDQGPVWNWVRDPGAWMGDWTGPGTDGTAPATIVWNEDPTLYGFQGSVGTVVDVHDL